MMLEVRYAERRETKEVRRVGCRRRSEEGAARRADARQWQRRWQS